MTMPKLKHPLVIRERKTSAAAVIIYSRAIVLKMTDSTWFPDPPVTLADLSTDTDALEQAEAAVRNRGKGLAEVRNGKLRQVNIDLDALRGYVQWVADANPNEAALIAASAGMRLKRVGARHKLVLAAERGAVPDSVKLSAKAVHKHAAYEWQVSADGGETWVSVGVSTVADITVPGLTSGVLYHFRFRSTVGRTTSNWCSPIRYRVP